VTAAGIGTIRTGAEVGIAFPAINDTSDASVKIDSIHLIGKGLGSVVRVIQMRFLPPGHNSNLPVSAYGEVPPALQTTRGCLVARLRPVPGSMLRIRTGGVLWTILLGIRPGRYVVSGFKITYTQSDTRYYNALPDSYDEVLPDGFSGLVTSNQPLYRVESDPSGGCSRRSHLLKGVRP
jgi:hypothetical protein